MYGLRCIQSTVRSENRVNFALVYGEYDLVKIVCGGNIVEPSRHLKVAKTNNSTTIFTSVIVDVNGCEQSAR